MNNKYILKMKLDTKYILLILLSLIINQVIGQIPVGEWRGHLPYNEGKLVTLAENRVYCVTGPSMFYYDKDDNGIYKLSKINKLSDLDISYIAYSKTYKKLIVGYKNGNIDVLKDDNKYNYPDIKIKEIIAEKTINHILIYGDFAYISTGFGIVVFNLKKDEFADSYIIGKGGSYMNINNTAIYNNEIYALTDKGIYKGDLDDPFLANYENWTKVNNLLNPDERYYLSTIFNKKLTVVNSFENTDSCHVSSYDGTHWDTIFVNETRIKSIEANDSLISMVRKWRVRIFNKNLKMITNHGLSTAEYAILDNDKSKDMWIADKTLGLVYWKDKQDEISITPNGPRNKNIFKLYYNNGDVLVAPGGHAITGENAYNRANTYNFTNEKWVNLTDNEDNYTAIKDLRDVVSFASQQNSNNYMASAWRYGLFEVSNNKVINVYTKENTGGVLNSMSAEGITYDDNGNFYMVVDFSDKPFVVKTPKNKWYSYTYDSKWAGSTKKLINTKNGDKWAISNRGNGIFVWNDNLTLEFESDDIYKSFDLRDQNNRVINKLLNDIVQDVEGAVWIATGDGVAVYDYPENVLNEHSTFYARRPQIVVDGYLKALLEGENVTTIAVDGANRKWIGTEGGGLFLVSPDGTEQIMNWNIGNSKLFSNNIVSVDINQKTGEVFIGTDKGVESYKSTSTESKPDYSHIYAFPNPVKDGYNGIITIRGLVYQTNVKITDVTGYLVFETTSNGGDAIWNGKDMAGNKVTSGIYLVQCTTPDGLQSEVTKIMIIR